MSGKRWSARKRRIWYFVPAVLAMVIVSGCVFFATRDDSGDDAAEHRAPLVVQQGQSIAASGDGRLTAGPLHTCMLLGNGALKCWGDNEQFQLGIGSGGVGDVRGDQPGELGNAFPAVRFPTGVSVRSAAAGLANTCALLSDSTVRCWGKNDFGALGRPTAPPTDIVGDQPNEIESGTGVPLGRPVRALAGSYYSYCAILDIGDVKCWGDNEAGQLGIGDVVSRGGNPGDFTTLPRVELGTNRHALAIAGGYMHFCAILDNGSVKCWGLNDSGQLGIGNVDPKGGAPTDMGDNLPAVLLGTGRTAVAITAGGFHTCARLDDGTAKCWGNNTWGQLGVGDAIFRGNTGGANVSQYMGDNLPIVNVGAGLGVRSIQAGATHTCAILSNGKVKCWGNNAPPIGILGLERPEDQLGDTPSTVGDGLGNVNLGALRTARSIAVGYAHSCAWLDDGSVKCWGLNNYGQLGLGTTTNYGGVVGTMGDKLPAAHLRESIKMSPTGSSTCSILDNGSLKCWGDNFYGQLGLSDTTTRGTSPSQMGSTLYPVVFPSGRTVVDVSISISHACAVLDDGSVRCWGANGTGQLGSNSTTPTMAPGSPINLQGKKAKAVGTGWGHSCVLLDDGSVKCWGWNIHGELGIGSTAATYGDGPFDEMGSLPSVVLGAPARAISVGMHHTCALLDDATLKCWGSNVAGELGLGDPNIRTAPPTNPIDLGGDAALDVKAGGNFTCALLTGGVVKCWGYGANGVLGQGNPNNIGSAPSQMGTNLNPIPFTGEVVALSAGAAHACALFGDATVRCWGFNGSGQLGISNTQNMGDGPGEIAALPSGGVPLGTSVLPATVSAGFGHSCVLLSDGTRKCWGDNTKGQLGLGDNMTRGGTGAGSVLGDNLPTIKLGINRAAIAVAAGENDVCAILENGPVKCWGDNIYGQLGLGDMTLRGTTPGLLGDALPPVALGSGRSARQLAVAGGHACALLDNGAVKCWGKNNAGQLGVGDTNPRGTSVNHMNDALPAVPLTPGQSAVSIAVGDEHSCALLTNGTVQCWGSNGRGQLGQASTTLPSVPNIGDGPGELGINLPPVNLGGGRTARAIAATEYYTCALLDNGRVKCWGANDFGNLGTGDPVDHGVVPGQMQTLQAVDLGYDATTQQPRGSIALVPNCALLDDSTVKCWGDNTVGQLGLGNNTPPLGDGPDEMGELLPRTPLGRTAVALSSSRKNRCVLLDDGKLKCWGWNDYGQLGLESSAFDTLPNTVSSLAAVKLGTNRTAFQFSVSPRNTCAVLDTGAVKCWGDNAKGQLGRGETTAAIGYQVGQMGDALVSASVGDTKICGGLPSCNLTSACAPGTPVPSDNNPCTIDSCSPETGVRYTPSVGAPCNDGNPATTIDRCDSRGICVGSTVPLDDGNPCTHDVAVGATHTHNPEPSGFPCGTNQVCNGGGTCVAASSIPTPPEDPAPYAPVPRTIGTSFEHRYSYLYAGPHAVQTPDPVTPLALEPERLSLVHGNALDNMGRPLPSVTVKVQGHPEMGKTLSRADGVFDLAVNGGGTLNLVYERTGFFPVHRKIKPRWKELAAVEPVTLTPPDAQYDESGAPVSAPITVTPCTGTCPLKVVRGRSVTDATGTRRATVMMPTDAVATINGTSTPLASMTIRATEFTDGTRGGPSAMPGPLPFNVAYTYAVELSLDEAKDANGQFDPNLRVNFSKNVPVYVDNYRNFATGTPVPLGYYDRKKGNWVPMTSGRVVKIVSINTSVVPNEAQLDVNTTTGDPVTGVDPATDTTTGDIDLSKAERQKLATLYPAGQLPVTLMRITVDHFTPMDTNKSAVGPTCANGGSCTTDVMRPVAKATTGCQTTRNGSIIECEARAVGERVAVAGTPYSLNYRSRRAAGYSADRTGRFEFNSCVGNTHSKRTAMCVADGAWHYRCTDGCSVTEPFETVELPLQLTPDRSGVQTVYVLATDTYSLVYNQSGSFMEMPRGASFSAAACMPGSVSYDPRWPQPWLQDCTLTISQTFSATGYFYDARKTGIGGWTVSAHHDFDAASGILELGTGERRYIKGYARILRKFLGASGDYFGRMNALASGPDGSLYYVKEGPDDYLYRLKPDGLTTVTLGIHRFEPDYATTIAMDSDGSMLVLGKSTNKLWRVLTNGSTVEVISSPSMPSTLGSAKDLAVADDGSIYILDSSTNRIYRLDPEPEQIVGQPVAPRRLSVLAGTGVGAAPAPYNGDAFAADVALSFPHGMALGPDGSIYVLSQSNSGGVTNFAVHRIDQGGRIKTVIGPATGIVGDWGQLEVDSVGRIYYQQNKTIKYLDTDGTIHVAAGKEGAAVDATASNVPATSVGMNPFRFTLLPDDSLVISEFAGTLRRVTPFDATGEAGCASLVPSEDAAEAYCFDADGRHLKTIDANTGADLLSFGYEDDQLRFITDANNNVTEIKWFAPGWPQAIVGPFGQATSFNLDADLNLNLIGNPDGTSVGMTYWPGGLLKTFSDTRNFVSSFVYAKSGELESETLPNQGTQSISETVVNNGTTGNDQTSTFKTPLANVSPPSTPRNPSVYKTTSSPANDRAVKVTTRPNGVRSRFTESSEWVAVHEMQDGTTETLDTFKTDPRFGVSGAYKGKKKVQITRGPQFASGVTPQSLPLTYEENRTRTFTTGIPKQHREGLTIVGSSEQSVLYTEKNGATPANAVLTSPAGRTVTLTYDLNNRIDAVTTPRVGGGSVVSDLQYNGSGGRLSRIVVGDATSGYRVPRGLTYYPTSLDAKSGYVQTIDVGSVASPDPSSPITSLLTANQTPDAFGRVLSETVNTNTAQFQWFGYDQLGALDTPTSKHHGLTYTPTTTTYAPPTVSGNPNTVTQYNLDGEVDLITRPDNKAVDYKYGLTTGQLSVIAAQTCTGGTCADDPTMGAVTIGHGPPLVSCSGGADFCACTDATCGVGNSPGLVSLITGPSPVKVSLGYTGSLLAQTVLDKTGSPDEPLFKKAELDWTYSNRLLIESESLTVTQTAPPAPFGVRSAVGYDADGLPSCVAQTAAGACDSSPTSIATGKVEKITYDSGVAVPTLNEVGILKDTYAYNKFNDLASITTKWYTTANPPVGTDLYKMTYDDGTTNTAGSRDALGRVKRKTEVRGGHTTETNSTYDASGRLWTVNTKLDGVANGSRTYTYDANGNRALAGSSYDAQDRLTSFGTGGCGTATKTCFTYSAAGELLTKQVGSATNTYTYDVFGNLRKVVRNIGGAMTIDYLANGLGRRVGKKVGGALKQEFVYRGNGLQIAAEIDSTTGKLKSRFFYGTRSNVPDFMERADPVTPTNPTKTYRIITDQLGSPVMVVNTLNQNDVLLDVDYDEWGNLLCRKTDGTTCAPDGAGPCVETKCVGVIPFGFAGGLYDPDTGLVRFGARDYDPSIGRWVSKDPILFGGGQANLYVYVGNDPVNRRDPSGLEPLPQGTKDILAPFFPGLDLGQIDVHADASFGGDEDAYADGNDLYFSPGMYNPNTIEGIAFLSHEIAHAAQDAASPRGLVGFMDAHAVEVSKYGRENSSREVIARLVARSVMLSLRGRYGVLNGDVRELSGENMCR
jgi:RHS repeat-associated protein